MSIYNGTKENDYEVKDKPYLFMRKSKYSVQQLVACEDLSETVSMIAERVGRERMRIQESDNGYYAVRDAYRLTEDWETKKLKIKNSRYRMKDPRSKPVVVFLKKNGEPVITDRPKIKEDKIIEVVRLLSLGTRYKEIAQSCSISIRSVGRIASDKWRKPIHQTNLSE